MRSRKIQTVLVIAALLGLLVFFNALFSVAPLESFILTLTSPFVKTSAYISHAVTSFFKTVIHLKDASSENVILHEENKKLRSALVGYEEVKRENVELRAQLSVSQKEPYQIEQATLVGFDPLSLAHSVLIDKGSAHGVQERMPVLLAGNILLGKVERVYHKFSHVSLLSDTANKANVISRDGGAKGVLGGSVGNLLLMDLIERDAALHEGDLIITSGLDSVYPRALIVGEVAEVLSQQEGIFKQAHIKPAYTTTINATVFIITNYLR